jgi:hypothetical protein
MHVNLVTFAVEIVVDIPQQQQQHCHYKIFRQNAYPSILH